ncbi:MAG: hypothetical protein Q9214_003127 [Letrouitia sp. 1 TL-2023]
MPWADSLAFMPQPSPLSLLVAVFVILSIPLVLHTIVYRHTSDTLPTFLLVGPSGVGKTSLVTLLERGHPSATHTSQAPLTVEISLPVKTPLASSRYRSAHDPTWEITKKFLIQDTPGHGKLRYHVTDSLPKPRNLHGIVFMVDAADLSSIGGDASEGLRQAAEYLHDVLLTLQKRKTNSKTSTAPNEMPLLVMANKSDLFSALPVPLVKKALETEITKIRSSRGKGLLDSGTADVNVEENRECLGDGGEGKFEFSQMEEVNVPVKIVGGNVTGPDGSDVRQLWEWFGSIL